MLDPASPVRDLAYQLWVEQGCPVGRDKENWLEAERLLSEARDRAAMSKKEKKAEGKKSKSKGK